MVLIYLLRFTKMIFIVTFVIGFIVGYILMTLILNQLEK